MKFGQPQGEEIKTYISMKRLSIKASRIKLPIFCSKIQDMFENTQSIFILFLTNSLQSIIFCRSNYAPRNFHL